MTNHIEAADAYEAWLDATLGLDPALIGAEPQQEPANRFVVDDDHKPELVRVTKAPAWNVLKPQLIPARATPLAEATIEVIDPRTGEVRVVPVPGVRVKRGPHEVFTPKPALAP